MKPDFWILIGFLQSKDKTFKQNAESMKNVIEKRFGTQRGTYPSAHLNYNCDYEEECAGNLDETCPKKCVIE